ncbi:ATP-binding protein [Candidatus Binatia bacterium]|nr:ATP-binding protein [Candidatus Binatia bacterium]
MSDDLRRPLEPQDAAPLATTVEAAARDLLDLLEGIDAIVWEADPGTLAFTYVSPRAEQILGYPVAAWVSAPDFWITHLHPEDRPVTLATCRAAIAAGCDHEIEYRMLAADGRAVWVHDSVRIALDAAGRPHHLRGIMTDVSVRKRAEDTAATVLEIVREIGGSLDLERILERVQTRTAMLLPCDRVITYYADSRRGAFVMIGAHGLPARLVEAAAAMEFFPGDPAIDRLAAGESVTMTAADADGPFTPALLRQFEIGAVAAVPLSVRGRVLGAYVAANNAGGPGFTAAQVGLLESLARHLAVAFETTELYRAKEEEAEVGAALARVGREMISSLDAPILLERLCQLTTQVLDCDCSHTLMWRPEAHVFVPVAMYGYSPEEWATGQVLRIPGTSLAGEIEAFRHADVLQQTRRDLLDPVLLGYVNKMGLTVGMVMALRRGTTLIGMHVACYRGRREPFAPAQERIAGGIAQIASLALENARLVEELGRASRLKSDFLATMSHELRTPLNAIVGYTSLLIDGAYGSLAGEQEDVLRRLDKSAGELLELINSTLDVSRLESGRMPMDIQDVSVTGLLQEVDAETRALREKPGLNFVWDVPARLPRLRTDPLKLKVILKNLIGNAVKFTDCGSVRVGARRVDRGVIEFSVTDTGIGIDPSVRNVIFEPFRQADSSDSRRHGGVGLGLYVVRRLVDSLGGDLALESAVGQGSTFRVSVPSRNK